jgi:HupE / UreJ protein
MRVLILIALSGWISCAVAHKASDSYLNLNLRGATIDMQWDIALRDLDFALGLDADGDGTIRWGEIRTRQADLIAYALAHLKLRTHARCVPGQVELLVDEHTDGGYAVLRYAADCGRPVDSVEIDYRLFAALDPQHRGLVQVTAGSLITSAVLGPDDPTRSISVTQASVWAVAGQYLKEGFWHILIGYDHILFLVSLLLPILAWRTRDGWQAAANQRVVWVDVLKTVTAFTVAHSITLALAALGIVSLPSRAVESVIAGSVVFAAICNLSNIRLQRRWQVAFGFGLIHGFGFAGVLGDLGLPPRALSVALFSFNLGVELGQLALVGLFLPAYFVRESRFYRYGIYQTGSAATAVIALGWFLERAAGIDLPVW